MRRAVETPGHDEGRGRNRLAGADRYATYEASFRSWAARMDQIVNNSAAQTGGTRHVRFVTDSSLERRKSPRVPVSLAVELRDSRGFSLHSASDLSGKARNKEALLDLLRMPAPA